MLGAIQQDLSLKQLDCILSTLSKWKSSGMVVRFRVQHSHKTKVQQGLEQLKYPWVQKQPTNVF